MKELTHFSFYFYALRLQQALTSAGIEATIISETANPYTGMERYTVWVADHADLVAVERVCSSLPEFEFSNSESKGSRVSVAEGLTACPCGYDLRGKIKNGNCPECGRPYVLAPEKQCPKCGEKIPVDFEVCWQCGAELPPAVASNS